MSDTPWVWQGNQLKLKLHIQPGAKTSEISGLHNGRLKIRLNAQPVDGKANKALILFISQIFKVSKSSVIIEKGQSSRLKTLLIEDPQFLPAEFLSLQSQKPMVPAKDSQ